MTQQEYENKIKELQDELEKLKAAEIKAEQPKRWKPTKRDKYMFVGGIGVGYEIWGDTVFDDWCYLTGNCFKTFEEAEEYKKQIEYTARYKNYIEEHSEPLNWKDDGQVKYYATFSYISNSIIFQYRGTLLEQGVIYASSEQVIWDAIKEIGEDNFKKYVLGVK